MEDPEAPDRPPGAGHEDETLPEPIVRSEDGEETADSELLDLPVEFALDMNRLSPSANVSPLTSASATPSPPPRHYLKPKTKISFEDEGFVL